MTFEEAKKVLFEEMSSTTLGATDITGLTYSLVPYLIWREINLGAHRRQVFMQACEVTDMLVGVAGDRIHVPILDRDEFTAATISEDNLDNNGYTKTKITPDSIRIKVSDVVYVATKISDILLEDSPTLGWVRASLQKMGEAIAYKIEDDIETALYACAGNLQAAATAGILQYDDIINVKSLMAADSYWDTEGGPFLLFINPEQWADLIKERGVPAAASPQTGPFSVPTERYAMGDLPLVGYTVYAGCKVLATEVMRDHFALVVIPPTHQFGPAAIFAWKRHIKAESWRGSEAQYGRTVYLLSCRYGVECKMTNGVGLISNC